jgi:hypothetical protein
MIGLLLAVMGSPLAEEKTTSVPTSRILIMSLVDNRSKRSEFIHVMELPVSYSMTTSRSLNLALTDGLFVGSPNAETAMRSS